MAGRGPSPKGSRSRARDTPTRDLVKSDGKLGGRDLPEGWLGVDKDTGELVQWHPATVDWWQHWRASPQGTRMLTEPDWDFLLDTALMHHTMWANQRWEYASEIRLRAAKFGATPEDRMRLKLEVEVPEKFPAGNRGNDGNVTRLDARRDRWGA